MTVVFMEWLEINGTKCPRCAHSQAAGDARLGCPFRFTCRKTATSSKFPWTSPTCQHLDFQKVMTLTFQSGISWTKVAVRVPCRAWAARLTHPRQEQGNAMRNWPETYSKAIFPGIFSTSTAWEVTDKISLELKMTHASCLCHVII